MGFRIQKEANGSASVAQVVPYEAASCAGVKAGDLVVGMEGARREDYDTLMLWLQQVHFSHSLCDFGDAGRESESEKGPLESFLSKCNDPSFFVCSRQIPSKRLPGRCG